MTIICLEVGVSFFHLHKTIYQDSSCFADLKNVFTHAFLFNFISYSTVIVPVKLVGNSLVLGVWVTCDQSVGDKLFIVNALSTYYPWPRAGYPSNSTGYFLFSMFKFFIFHKSFGTTLNFFD